MKTLSGKLCTAKNPNTPFLETGFEEARLFVRPILPGLADGIQLGIRKPAEGNALQTDLLQTY